MSNARNFRKRPARKHAGKSVRDILAAPEPSESTASDDVQASIRRDFRVLNPSNTGPPSVPASNNFSLDDLYDASAATGDDGEDEIDFDGPYAGEDPDNLDDFIGEFNALGNPVRSSASLACSSC